MTAREQIERYGYGILPGIVSAQETEFLVSSLDNARLPRSRAGIRHLMTHPAVSRIAHSIDVMNIVKAILGKDAIPFRATLFDKSPASNWLVMWHQDTALPLSEKREMEGWGPWSVKDGVTYAHAPASALEQVLAVRIHLDDSNLSNGPLRILPETHLQGVLSDPEIHELSGAGKSVDCPVSKGGIVLMRPLVVHASSKSTSDEPRRVIHIEYASQRAIASDKVLAIA